jgi:hypothetical protein
MRSRNFPVKSGDTFVFGKRLKKRRDMRFLRFLSPLQLKFKLTLAGLTVNSDRSNPDLIAAL